MRRTVRPDHEERQHRQQRQHPRDLCRRGRPAPRALHPPAHPEAEQNRRLKDQDVHLHIYTVDSKDVIVIVPTNGAAANFPMGSEVNLIFGGNVAHVFSKEDGHNLEW